MDTTNFSPNQIVTNGLIKFRKHNVTNPDIKNPTKTMISKTSFSAALLCLVVKLPKLAVIPLKIFLIIVFND